MRLGAVPVLVAIGILCGCGDATAPAASTRVGIAVMSVSGPEIFQPSPSETRIQCTATLHAAATGSGSATWVDGQVFFFAGPNRSDAIDTLPLNTSDLEQAWGAAEIRAGENLYTAWQFQANVPFGVTFRFRYRSRGLPESVDASFNCGPDVPAGSSPPALKQAVLHPSSGEIESGDTLTVTYTATSQVGLWETAVVVGGACETEVHFTEAFAPSVTRTVKLAVPTGCRLNAALDVDVQAFDIALRGVGARVSSGLTFVDRTPPEVGVWFGHNVVPDLGGFFFAGDTLRGRVGAADNNQLSGAFWEVWPAGWRDSLRLSEQSLAADFVIPIPDAWVGRIQMRFYSRDAAGLTSDTLYRPPDSLRIYPTVVRPMRFTPPILDIRAVTLDMRRNKAWVLMQEHNVFVYRVYGVDLGTMEMTDTIPVTKHGWDLDMTPSGDSLIVLSGYGFAVIDLRTSPRTETLFRLGSVDSTIGQYPQAVRVAANGKIFVILVGQTVQANKLLEVDLSAGTDRVRTDAGAGGVIGGVGLEHSLDRSVLFLNGSQGIQRYVSATDAFSAPRPHSSAGGGLAVDATGSRVTIGWDLYDGALQFQRRMDTPSPYASIPAALSPDGKTFYHAVWPQGILSSTADDGRLVDRQRTPQTFYLKMFRDGTKLVFADAQFGRLGVMDLR